MSSRMHMTKTRLGAVAALTLGLAAAGLGGSAASATPSATVERLEGVDRYGTAEALATDTFDQSTTAFVASGERFPDALAAAGLAGSHVGPILLVTETTVPVQTQEALAALDVDEVVILGGTAAVSQGVEDQLAALYSVDRIAGVDRFDTAAQIARVIQTNGSIGAYDGQRAAFLSRGDDFPDVLATGPLAYFGSVPVLLSQTEALNTTTSAVLDDLDIEIVIIAGGTAAISADVVSAIEAKGIDVLRLFGADRQQTAAAMADFGVENFGLLAEHANITRGDKFPDALAGGAHAGDLEMSPILLTSGDALGAPTTEWLEARCSTLQTLHVFGGTAAVPASVATEAQNAARSC